MRMFRYLAPDLSGIPINNDGYYEGPHLYPRCSRSYMEMKFRENDFVLGQKKPFLILDSQREITIAKCPSKEDAQNILDHLRMERLLSEDLPKWVKF